MSALDALAARAGIEGDYIDAAGARQEASQETKRALLAALGLPDDDAAAALAALDADEWRHPLPPVQVIYADAVASVTLTLPAQTGAVAWRLDLEAGGALSGTVDFATLDLVEGRDGVERRLLPLPPPLPSGYHRLSLADAGVEMGVIVSPGRCWLPPARRRLWGIAAQLYLLRSAENWGIGDFSDLRRLIDLVAAQGGDVVGVNPLHALFLDTPELASPYSPSSRLLLNPLYIDIPALPELARCPVAQALIAAPDFQRRLSACRAAPLVDYTGVTALKLPVLRALFAARNWAQQADFAAFRRAQGAMLTPPCLFLALRAHFAARTPPLPDWRDWPVEYRDPNAPGARDFTETHQDAIAFQLWLQFLADRQLGAAAEAAAGMAVGLYRDLAVGAARQGAEVWVNRAGVVATAQIGCPPDLYNPAGQDWGLPPFRPRGLREEGYRGFIELLRANMRHAGALRIDHVMALQHLYWIPRGHAPADGAFVRSAREDLIGILALESQRHRCLVIGEDLGTVPEGLRARLATADILSYRILLFEQEEKTGRFLPPDRYPALALAMAGSHDLPSLRAWWEASDLDLKATLGLFPEPAAESAARRQRRRDRGELLKALRRSRLLPSEGEVTMAALNGAVHGYLARSQSLLTLAQLDDITDEREPVNVPCTGEEHPNWRRRLSLTLDEIAAHPRLAALVGQFRAERAGLFASDKPA